MRQYIKHDDMEVIRKLAEKYGVSIIEFGKAIVSQEDIYKKYYVRYSEQEYEIMTKKAKAANLQPIRLCELCCKRFVEMYDSNNIDTSIFQNQSTEISNKTRRLTIKILNSKTRRGLQEISDLYSIKMSTLIRLCVLNIDA